MKIKRFFLFCTLSLSATLFAQTDALLWKVSGNGLTKPSYLFGTVHAYCDWQKLMTGELIGAIQASDVVAMEVNLNDFSTFAALMKASAAVSEKPITSYLSPSEAVCVDSVCKAFLGVSLSEMDHQKPMTLMARLYLSDSMIGCRPLPVDFMIAELAKRSGKKSVGLETPGFQDSLLSSVSDSIQVRWLLDLCQQPMAGKKELKALMQAYDAQESDSLYQISFRTSPEMSLLKNDLLDERNRRWVGFLTAHFPSQAYFVAVGAAHLRGEEGLLNLLTKAGYILTPIRLQY